jgi:hypothetical protein
MSGDIHEHLTPDGHKSCHTRLGERERLRRRVDLEQLADFTRAISALGGAEAVMQLANPQELGGELAPEVDHLVFDETDAPDRVLHG